MKIVDNLLVLPYVSNLRLKVLVLVAITIQFSRLFQASTTLLVKQACAAEMALRYAALIACVIVIR